MIHDNYAHSIRLVEQMNDAELDELLHARPDQVFTLGRPAPMVQFFPPPQLRGDRPPVAGTLRHGRAHRMRQRR